MILRRIFFVSRSGDHLHTRVLDSRQGLQFSQAGVTDINQAGGLAGESGGSSTKVERRANLDQPLTKKHVIFSTTE
jgi:hypothetical protein